MRLFSSNLHQKQKVLDFLAVRFLADRSLGRLKTIHEAKFYLQPWHGQVATACSAARTPEYNFARASVFAANFLRLF